MSYRSRVFPNLGALAVLVGGCASDGPRSEAAITRDSAGISIVEVDLSVIGRARTLANEPLLSLGVVEGNPAQEFDGVRSALRFSDGSVAVVNGGSNEIRFFTRHGDHRGSMGGTGDGPGEYQGLSNIGRAGTDTIFAFDRWLQRVSLLTRSGGLVWTRQLPFEGAAKVDRLADGSLIPVSFLVGMPRRPRGIHADTAKVARYTVSAPAPDTLFAVTTLEWFSHGDAQPPTPLPWGRTTFIASGGEVIHVAQSDRFEFRSYRADGRLQRIVRSDQSRAAMDDRAYEHMKATWLSSTTDRPGTGVDPTVRWADLPRPEHLPELTALQVEENGRVWLERFEPDPTKDRVWFGFEDGAPAGVLRISRGLRVLDISFGHVVVRRTDELGVEYVDVYRVIEP